MPRVTRESCYRLAMLVRGPDRLSISVGVRRAGSPYNYLWQKTQSYPPAWREVVYYFRCDAADYDVNFYLMVNGAGAFDLAGFRLERFTLEELAAHFLSLEPETAPKNLVRQSRFPLGLETGWVIDRDLSDGEDVVVAPDGDVSGPTGAPALRIRPRNMATLYSAPVRLVRPTEKHTASLFARGASGRLIAIGDSRTLATRAFSPSGAAWQRVAVTFQPDLLARVHALRIEAAGEFWIDGLQVEAAGQATVYASPGQAEVHLGVDSAARVVFDDQDPMVRWAVTGEAEGSTLRARVANLYDGEKPLAPVPLAGGFLRQGRLRFDVFAGRPLGTFRVEAWVENGKGERISPYGEVVVHRLRRPRYWMKDAPNSPFGVHTNSTLRHILMAKAAGINWVRLHDAGTPYMGWYHLERKPGEWSFQDRQLERYREYGLKILGAFATAPEWASYFDKPRNSYYDRYYQPRNLDEYGNYTRLVAGRYADLIDACDLWNEPWIPSYWAVGYDQSRQAYLPSANPQRDFANLARTAWENAKEMVPSLRIAGVNSTTGAASGDRTGGTEWTRGVVEAGGLDYCDIICYHQYSGDLMGHPNDSVAAGFRAAIGPALDPRGRPPKPVWMTEGSSVTSRTGAGFYRYTLPSEEFEDPWDTSDRLCRFLVSLLAQGVEKVFLYSMHTHVYFGGGNQYRVLVGEDGYLHPSAAAHSALAWLLEDTRFVKSLTPAEGVTAYLFEGAGRSLAVLAPMPNHAAWSLPSEAALALTDLFGNPLQPGAPLDKTLVYAAASLPAAELEKRLLAR